MTMKDLDTIYDMYFGSYEIAVKKMDDIERKRRQGRQVSKQELDEVKNLLKKF